jgi:DtxR family Mn-dependent transcriptional regulator
MSRSDQRFAPQGAPVASLTIENYVKAIYQLSAGADGRAAATGKLAEVLEVSPGTVTSMLKTLGESGLVEYAPYEGARLTDAGRTLALRVLRRHRLIELFLVRTLHLSWDEVHAEAEHMEHAVSDFLIDRIDAYLGFPATDPHGDPIPKADGTVAGPSGRRLSQLAAGARFRVARVVDQSPEFLRYLTETGLTLDAEGKVIANRAESGTITVEIAGRQTTLAHSVADRLLVD